MVWARVSVVPEEERTASNFEISSGPRPRGWALVAKTSGGIFSLRSSRVNASWRCSSLTPRPCRIEAAASRWDSRTVTSPGRSPSRSNVPASRPRRSNSAFMEGSPITSAFHCKNSRSRPRWGRSPRKNGPIPNHRKGKGLCRTAPAANLATVGVNSGRRA